MNHQSAKRKSRPSGGNRVPRNKSTGEKNMVDGVYGNGRFMHAAASLVGCLVQVITVSGTVYEGILRTFSPQFHLVVELAHRVDSDQPRIPSKDMIVDKLIFKITDIVCMTASNTDLEYATKDTFATDTVISKFNGQIQEKELEPWDGASGEADELPILDAETAQNGWDANEMFRTNEQQYGVQSTYEPTLAGYTTPLERKNTDEYKKQEAKASKIASEIENSPTFKNRNDVENGDEEERISAVARPEPNVRPDSNTQKYVPPAKRKNSQLGKPTRNTMPVQNSHGNIPSVKSHHPPGHMQHHIGNASHVMHGPAMQAPLAHAQQGSPHPQATHYGPPPQQQQQQQPSSMGGAMPSPHPVASQQQPQQQQPPPLHHPHHHHYHPQVPPLQTQQLHQQQQQQQPPPPPREQAHVAKMLAGGDADSKVNGEKVEKEEKKVANLGENAIGDSKEDGKVVPDVTLPPPHIHSKIDRKNSNPKGEARDEITTELKKFSTDFKLTEETNKDEPRQEFTETKDKVETEMEKVSNTLKKSTLNPNAKEFIFNPNAKSFTPRSPSTQTPTPPRPHTPSTAMTQPPTMSTMSMMPAHLFQAGLAPQYMMPAPVSGVSLAPQFNPNATMQQPPRMRKTNRYLGMPASVHQQRHEFSQVAAAATGQPILAPPTLQAPHLAVQYPQGMVPNPGQPTMPYPQVYSVVAPPRMMNPHQAAIPMVPTSHANNYPDNQHVHNQVFVSTHPSALPNPLTGPNPQHHAAATPLQTHPAGPHSTPPNQQGPMAGQNQGGGVHPNPSPVHQSPHGGAPNQPTPPGNVGNPQSLVYQTHAAQLGQPSLQPSPHTPNSPQTTHPSQNQAYSHNPHMHHNQVTHAATSSHGGPHMTQTHPHHPGTPGPSGYPPAGQPLVLIPQAQAAMSTHPQGVPGGHTFQPGMHGPGNPGPHVMASMVLPTSGAATMPSHPALHYIPQHALTVQLQLLPNPCNRTLILSEQENSKMNPRFIRLKQDPKSKKT